jgi:hypothetical protein
MKVILAYYVRHDALVDHSVSISQLIARHFLLKMYFYDKKKNDVLRFIFRFSISLIYNNIGEGGVGGQIVYSDIMVLIHLHLYNRDRSLL